MFVPVLLLPVTLLIQDGVVRSISSAEASNKTCCTQRASSEWLMFHYGHSPAAWDFAPTRHSISQVRLSKSEEDYVNFSHISGRFGRLPCLLTEVPGKWHRQTTSARLPGWLEHSALFGLLEQVLSVVEIPILVAKHQNGQNVCFPQACSQKHEFLYIF